MAVLAFYIGNGDLVNRTIRAVTRGRESHVEFLLLEHIPQRFPQVARAISSSARDGGVREKEITFKKGQWAFVEVPWAPPDAYYRIQEHIGKPYDFMGLFLCQLFNFRRQNDQKWWCSEICAHALNLPNPHRFSPSELRLELEAINQIMTGENHAR